MSTPQRIKISRQKGWRMPPDTVKVDRTTKFGNPFRSDEWTPEIAASGARTAAEAFRLWLTGHPALARINPNRRVTVIAAIKELRGKNLACWCPLDQPCHADVLLELANAPASTTGSRDAQ